MPFLAAESGESPAAIAAALAGKPIRDVASVSQSGNSRVFRVTTDDAVFALKLYPPHTVDPRDRLGAESTALGFMERNRLGPVPRLLAADRGHNAALLEWIDGERVLAPTGKDVDAALAFLERLHALRDAAGAGTLSLASEACLSAAEVEAQIARRFSRLAESAIDRPALRSELDRMTTATAAAVARGHRAYAEIGLDWDTAVDPVVRTLSPSDFGFHNALRRADGSLVFLDFEYFGWDDPAKLVCDVLLHPGMDLDESLGLRFLAGARAIYGADPHFAGRVASLFPLFGLRWCGILLNEFLPEKWAARAHAGESNIGAAQKRQLAKATALLERLLDPRDAIQQAFHD